jgi:peptidoglycan/xylan/chitin deacetylase (PgdA/CDA1 family)
LLTAQIDGSPRSWQIPQGAAPRSSADWRGWQPPANEHQQLYQDMWRTLQVLEPAERSEVLAALWTEWPQGPQVRDSHRTVTSVEFDQLAASKLIEIGAHTFSHARLSSLSEAAQRTEIFGSRASLEERLDRRVSIFSYPHGGHADFTSATVQLVREAGYRLACTAYPGLTRTWTDRYRLPRVVVEDWDGDEFARRLRDWLPE